MVMAVLECEENSFHPRFIFLLSSWGMERRGMKAGSKCIISIWTVSLLRNSFSFRFLCLSAVKETWMTQGFHKTQWHVHAKCLRSTFPQTVNCFLCVFFLLVIIDLENFIAASADLRFRYFGFRFRYSSKVNSGESWKISFVSPFVLRPQAWSGWLIPPLFWEKYNLKKKE